MANVVLKENNQLLLVKPENGYGVDPLPDGSNAVTVKSVNIEAIHDKEEFNRVIGYLGAQGAITVREYVKVMVELYLIGSGAPGTPPAFAPFLLASANAEVTTVDTDVQYTPVDSGLGSLGIYWRAGSLQQKVLGVRGAVSRNYEIGKAPFLSFDGFGIYTDPTADNAAVTGVNTQMAAPVAVRKETVTTMSFFGQNVKMQSLKITDGNQFEYTELIGLEEVEQGGRKGSVDVKFRCTEDEYVLFLEKSKTNAYGALEMQFGVTGGQIFHEDIPQLQMNSVPKLSWDKGISYLSVTCDIVPQSKNTDYTLTLM